MLIVLLHLGHFFSIKVISFDIALLNCYWLFLNLFDLCSVSYYPMIKYIYSMSIHNIIPVVIFEPNLKNSLRFFISSLFSADMFLIVLIHRIIVEVFCSSFKNVMFFYYFWDGSVTKIVFQFLKVVKFSVFWHLKQYAFLVYLWFYWLFWVWMYLFFSSVVFFLELLYVNVKLYLLSDSMFIIFGLR